LTRKLQPRAAAAAIAQAFHDACLAELDALKPGNVHRHGDGHGMSCADFEASAKAAAPSIGRAKLGVGARIKQAVDATQQVTGLNTNLGIILLSAPLASAAYTPGDGDLHARVASVLANLTVEDAREAYRAIRAARPGGLGDAPEHDVASEPSVTLLDAMRAAETRDRIAWNYTHDFVDVFDMGLIWLKQARERWGDGPWSATRVYLGFLAHVPDTLIERKFGDDAAAEVAEEARAIEASFAEAGEPEDMTAPLLSFDRSLKERGLNPGTSADLTVATLFAAALQDLEKAE
jgi:triphosphoribosyl-dephospho-CoA synthase